MIGTLLVSSLTALSSSTSSSGSSLGSSAVWTSTVGMLVSAKAAYTSLCHDINYRKESCSRLQVLDVCIPTLDAMLRASNMLPSMLSTRASTYSIQHILPLVTHRAVRSTPFPTNRKLQLGIWLQHGTCLLYTPLPVRPAYMLLSNPLAYSALSSSPPRPWYHAIRAAILQLVYGQRLLHPY